MHTCTFCLKRDLSDMHHDIKVPMPFIWICQSSHTENRHHTIVQRTLSWKITSMRPPVLTENTVLSPTFQCNWTCYQIPPVLRNHIFMAKRVLNMSTETTIFRDNLSCSFFTARELLLNAGICSKGNCNDDKGAFLLLKSLSSAFTCI